MIKTINRLSLDGITLNAAYHAGNILRRNAFGNAEIEWKAKEDPVTELDRMAEQFIKDVINESLKEQNKGLIANFIGEEFGVEDNGGNLTFYIDPLDGTKSFLRKEFRSVVSIGVEQGEDLVGGFIYDFMRDIMYAGFGDDYYFIHGQYCKHCDLTPPSHASKFFDFIDGNVRVHNFNKRVNCKPRVSVDNKSLQKLVNFQDRFSIVKPEGSFAMAMMEVATGSSDAIVDYYNDKGSSYDVAGALYILKKFATVTDKDGNHFDYRSLKSNGMVAIRKELDDELRLILEERS